MLRTGFTLFEMMTVLLIISLSLPSLISLEIYLLRSYQRSLEDAQVVELSAAGLGNYLYQILPFFPNDFFKKLYPDILFDTVLNQEVSLQNPYKALLYKISRKDDPAFGYVWLPTEGIVQKEQS